MLLTSLRTAWEEAGTTRNIAEAVRFRISAALDTSANSESVGQYAYREIPARGQLVARGEDRISRIGRRAVDILAALAGISTLAFVLPVIAIAIKLDSPGPIFYRQMRVGLNRRRFMKPIYGKERRLVLLPGMQFSLLKFRTMVVDAESNGPTWAMRSDARVTNVGRLLRRTRIDELPIFINLLRGEMTLVGPRPERLMFVRQFAPEIPHYEDRLLVKPGLTGLAQVLNGYDVDMSAISRRLEYDLHYIAHRSFWLDIRILLLTVRAVITGDGYLS